MAEECLVPAAAPEDLNHFDRGDKKVSQEKPTHKEERKKALPLQKIAAFCGKWKIVEFAIFGSFVSEDFSAESDIDILVTYGDNVKWSLFDYMDMRDELKTILGREIDLVNKVAIERSSNAIKRRSILDPHQFRTLASMQSSQ